jgi:hypothetical protein
MLVGGNNGSAGLRRTSTGSTVNAASSDEDHLCGLVIGVATGQIDAVHKVARELPTLLSANPGGSGH